MTASNEIPRCPVCNNPANTGYDGAMLVSCTRCGSYAIGTVACHMLEALSLKQLGNVSGWIREHQNTRIGNTELEKLANLQTPSVGEKGNKLLSFLSNQYPKAGALISLTDEDVPLAIAGAAGKRPVELYQFIEVELISRTWSEDAEELLYLVDEFLIKEMKHLQEAGGARVKISPRGWAHLNSVDRENQKSQIGFIAMWFEKSMDPAHLAIEKAIQISGYEPLRIDRKEHNNKIDDEIIAGIRRSKFLVADFTGHRGGVYFEAGFASGLGIPVIWLCREDALKDLHFDTRQYNHISWTEDRLPELTNALQKRIEAILGRGPLISKA
jgi:nucleoside 2-deoxyribosyltransferase